MYTIIVSITTMFAFIFRCGPAVLDIDIKNNTASEPNTLVSYDASLYQPSEHVVEVEPEKLYSDEELDAIARTLAGECYDDKLEDKRKVAEVVVNRVSSDAFGYSIVDVVSAPGQFSGYWTNRPTSESDIQIAEEILTDWYENKCEALSEYLFFCSGPNRENIFRAVY